ncbi:thioredoxin reductase [Oceanobacillus oncorhynchi subsp. incaldanensis]|uniref:Thioredoxin reductase n=2 Tax=Oceanobacillus TaxID=182709 RepID=A0A0A1MCC3_9BACI|nr:thioredoxin-disulfide reductase [Oceanobacillus oncorhynchi]GIO17626.1 thioredoxin reductase [Oceanobacillus oncorhynchi subsp. incaldanensis]CEI83010.1 Thioredoxin reductase [Oceanobacillus oncorhynchi]
MYKTVILGTGPAGLTSAIYLARANMEPLILEGPEPGGQLTLTTAVENYPGFSDPVMGPELIDTMRAQAKRFGAQFKTALVKEVDFSSRPFRLEADGLGEIQAESVIVSTGARAKMLEIPGEAENLGRGVSTCATCDGFFFRDKKVVVVGGGDSAMEEALFLTKFAKEVQVIHRRNELRASKIMQDRAMNNEKISWIFNSIPMEILSQNNQLTGIRVKNKETQEEQLIETDGVFLAIGHIPNTDFLKEAINIYPNGYVKVEPGTTNTNIPGVFAAGDVQDQRYKQAVTAAGTGCMAAMDVETFIETNPLK